MRTRLARRAIRVADLAEPRDAGGQTGRAAAAPQHAAARPRCRDIFEVRRARPAARAGAADLAVRRAGVGAAGRGAAGRTTYPVRGCAGGDAGCRSRHLSVCDLQQHGGGDRRGRRWSGSGGGRLRSGDRQGVQHARRLWPFPDGTGRCDGTVAGRSRQRVRHQSPVGGAAAAGSMRCWCGRR